MNIEQILRKVLFHLCEKISPKLTATLFPLKRNLKARLENIKLLPAT